jgi:hypothetical protein
LHGISPSDTLKSNSDLQEAEAATAVVDMVREFDSACPAPPCLSLPVAFGAGGGGGGRFGGGGGGDFGGGGGYQGGGGGGRYQGTPALCSSELRWYLTVELYYAGGGGGGYGGGGYSSGGGSEFRWLCALVSC